MSMKYLGDTFDFHGGGEDLIFPHHENELAQSEGASGKEFVRYWLHNGLLNLRGEKMSKSTGHFFAMEDVLREYATTDDLQDSARRAVAMRMTLFGEYLASLDRWVLRGEAW